MKRIFSHVIKIALVLAMIICWVLSIGYTNRLTSVKILLIYILIKKNIFLLIFINAARRKDKDNPLAFTGWYEKKSKVY